MRPASLAWILYGTGTAMVTTSVWLTYETASALLLLGFAMGIGAFIIAIIEEGKR